jgi:hypothetical protein
MTRDWQALTALTGGASFQVERVRLTDSSIAIEGQFDLPPLAQLPADDQVFVAAFVRSHGSIKQMEALFGVSYPTIKNRLNRISGLLPMVEVQAGSQGEAGADAAAVLDRLERGEVSADQAVAEIRGGRQVKKSIHE